MSLFRGEYLENCIVPTGDTLKVTDADALLVGGVKIAQTTQVESPILAAASIPTIFYISDNAYQVTLVQEVHTTASTSGTLQVEKLTGTQAPGSGTVILTGTISTAGTANTVVSGTLVATLATIQLAKGDRLALVSGGTQTNLVGGLVEITLQRI